MYQVIHLAIHGYPMPGVNLLTRAPIQYKYARASLTPRPPSFSASPPPHHLGWTGTPAYDRIIALGNSLREAPSTTWLVPVRQPSSRAPSRPSRPAPHETYVDFAGWWAAHRESQCAMALEHLVGEPVDCRAPLPTTLRESVTTLLTHHATVFMLHRYDESVALLDAVAGGVRRARGSTREGRLTFKELLLEKGSSYRCRDTYKAGSDTNHEAAPCQARPVRDLAGELEDARRVITASGADGGVWGEVEAWLGHDRWFYQQAEAALEAQLRCHGVEGPGQGRGGAAATGSAAAGEEL